MTDSKKKYWTVGEIDATGVRGPHEVELKNISKAKYHLFIDIDKGELKEIVEKRLGGNFENIGFNEDWTITIEMFPEVNLHFAYTFFGSEFGGEIEAEFKFLFSGKRVFWVPGEDTATYIDIVMDFIDRIIKHESPFQTDYSTKTDLMKKVLLQRSQPFNLIKESDKDPLAEFLSAKINRITDGWVIEKELFPEIFVELTWNTSNGLDISFKGKNLKEISNYHVELLGIFVINHILRYITLHNEEKDLPVICYIMFSRFFTKEKNWEHRRA
ncbi:MAG: hypothetical protein ACFFD5_01165 [Candidatus Thorarchaeota archaeon]